MSIHDYVLLSSQLRWLYVDFNSFFASVEQQLHPRLRGRPVAVLPVNSETTSVIAASYEAKAFGIKTGTPVYEARRLCPDIICVTGTHQSYVEFHNLILKELDNHIPVTRVCSIDEMGCMLMDNENSSQRAKEIALSIKAGLARRVGAYVRCSIGLAPNRYLAKMATDLQKPDGLTQLDASNLPDRLMNLPLSDFPGIGRNMERRLIAAGVDSARIMLGLNASAMRKVWGSVWGERMWHLLRGIDLPDIETERHSVGHSHVLAPELRPFVHAKDVVRRLILKAASRMRRLGFCASALTISVRIENGERLHAERRCVYAQDSITFLTLMNEIWSHFMEQATRTMPLSRVRIKKISVVLYHLRAATDVEPDLFDAYPDNMRVSRRKADNLSFAMDRINQKYGRDAILMGMISPKRKDFTGTKIAFTRIPDLEEFSE